MYYDINTNPINQLVSIFLYFAFSSATVAIAILIATYISEITIPTRAIFLIDTYQTAADCFMSFENLEFGPLGVSENKSILNIGY